MTATLLGSTLFFLLLHAAVARDPDRPFRVSLKLSRGVAAALLAAVGFVSLPFLWPLWRQAFLVEHGPGSRLVHVVALIVGHLVADLLWFARGASRGEAPRRDLVVHHLLGVGACGAAVWLETGYALIAVGMTTEMLPVTSALGGLGQTMGRPALRTWSDRLGLAVIWGWRVPIWLFLSSWVTWGLVTGRHLSDAIRWAYPICLAAMVTVLVLDVYWSVEYRASLRSRRRGSAF